MEDKSLYNNQQRQEISANLQNYIDSMVEEIVLEGKPFDTQKKYLRKFSESEGLDYEHLEQSITIFIEIFEDIKKTPNKHMEKLAVERGQDCYISDWGVKNLLCRLPQNARYIIEDCKTGKFGFIDSKGNVVIEPQYIAVGDFYEGMAKVIKDKKWGYINYYGEEVIPFVYDGASDFTEGMASVKRSSKWGFIDKTGKEDVPCRYSTEFHQYSYFSEGLAPVERKHKRGYVDRKGNEVIRCDYDYAGSFSEGLACVQLSDSRLAVIDKNGNEVFDVKYDSWSKYSNGRLAVAIETPLGMKWGFIDKEGKEVVPCKYDYVEDFQEGMAVVQLNGKYGYIDTNGTEAIPCIYQDASSFSEGLACVQDDNLMFGFVDQKGTLVIPCIYHNASDFSEGLALVQFKNKWGFIDKIGREIIPCKYDPFWWDIEHTSYSWPSSFVGGLAKVSINGKKAYINKTDQTVWIE